MTYLPICRAIKVYEKAARLEWVMRESDVNVTKFRFYMFITFRRVLEYYLLLWYLAGNYLPSKHLPRFFSHIFSISFLIILLRNPQTTNSLTFLTNNISAIGGVNRILLNMFVLLIFRVPKPVQTCSDLSFIAQPIILKAYSVLFVF